MEIAELITIAESATGRVRRAFAPEYTAALIARKANQRCCFQRGMENEFALLTAR